MNRQLRELGRQVAEEQDASAEGVAADTQLDEVRARFLQSVAARPHAPRQTQVRWAAGISVAVAAIAALAFVLREPSTPHALSYRAAATPVAGQFVDAASTPRTLQFRDGSELNLSPHTAMRVMSLEARGARIALEDGALEVHVVHASEQTRWTFEAGPYRVEVLGTRFQLAWQRAQSRFAIRMREGRVHLMGPGLDRILAAGTSYETSPGAATDPPVVEMPELPAAESESTAEQSLALDALVERAERAETRDPPAAQRMFQSIREEHAGTRAASDAAFMLARLEGDSPRAIALLETYLREQPRGRFVDAALGRLLRTSHTLGDDARARRYATRYLERYPEGPYATEARQVITSAP